MTEISKKVGRSKNMYHVKTLLTNDEETTNTTDNNHEVDDMSDGDHLGLTGLHLLHLPNINKKVITFGHLLSLQVDLCSAESAHNIQNLGLSQTSPLFGIAKIWKDPFIETPPSDIF